MKNNDPLNLLLGQTLEATDLPGLPPPRRGKVRDVYDLGDRLLIVTSDRISAFDVVLGTIPCKGQVLNSIAAFWFEKTADVLPNHVLQVPDACAMLVKKLKPLPIEVVVRRYITGSLWREYEQGCSDMYGLHFEENLERDQRFDSPIITPTTKADLGEHDAPVSPGELVTSGQITAEQWDQVSRVALALFKKGEEEAQRHGLLLVDTKYEFGMDGQILTVMDEIHTPDSSRYWEAEGYDFRFRKGQPQKMLDKENIRQWLMERGFSGQGTPPALTDEVRLQLARTYLNLQKRLTGLNPEIPRGDIGKRLLNNLQKAGLVPRR